MKPQSYSPAHKLPTFAELVCSNSLKAERAFGSAAGLLKWEMEYFRLAYRAVGKKECCAGRRSVSGRPRAVFKAGHRSHKSDPNITVVTGEVENIDPDEYTIIATGPLTSGRLADSLKALCGEEYLSFLRCRGSHSYSRQHRYGACFFLQAGMTRATVTTI